MITFSESHKGSFFMVFFYNKRYINYGLNRHWPSQKNTLPNSNLPNLNCDCKVNSNVKLNTYLKYINEISISFLKYERLMDTILYQ